jgi:dTDP-glucose pyrophosphorylase
MLPITQTLDVFDYVVRPFLKYLNDNKFIFAYREVYNTKNYLEKKLAGYELKNFELVEIQELTRGQAETAYLALSEVDDSNELLIFNIDTFHLDLRLMHFDSVYQDCDGIIEVFYGNGSQWSYAEVKDNLVVRTKEKEQISNFASNGMYYFKSVGLYKDVFNEAKVQPNIVSELYVAPMYNIIIKRGGMVKVSEIRSANLVFCGTPEEYEAAKMRLNEIRE